MVTSWPKNFPGLGTTANHLAKLIADLSGGRYTVKVFGGGELVPALKCLDAVQEGTADLYHSADYYYQGKSKAFNFFTTVPRSEEHTSELQSLMRISYAVFCLQKKKSKHTIIKLYST